MRHSSILILALGTAMAFDAARASDIFEIGPSPASLDIGTSIRSAAMGGAGAAMFWGEPDPWVNPASLSTVHGIGWVAGRTKVAPDFSDGLVFDSQRLLVGTAGVGLSFMGQPISGLGRARLDTGPITIYDPFGTTEFSLIDETQGWGFGLSPLRVIDALRRAHGSGAAPLTDVGEVSFGFQAKRTHFTIEPDGQRFDVGETQDWGVTARLAVNRWWGPEVPFRLDVAGAYSALNHLRPGTQEVGGVPTRFDRAGLSIVYATATPSERSASPAPLPWWRPADVPGLTLGLTWDHEHRIEEAFDADEHVEHVGFEAGVFHLLALRVGYVADHAGDVEGMTFGGRVSLPIGRFGSVGYDVADVPRPSGFDRQIRQGWSVWLDPARFWGGSM